MSSLKLFSGALLALCAFACHAQTSATVAGKAPVASQATSAATSDTTASAADQSSSVGDLTLQQQIAKLPPLKDTHINVGAQSQQIVANLNDILRFYRAATESIQKVGEPSDILYAEQSRAQATQIAQLAFQSARNEAALLTRIEAGSGANATAPAQEGESSESQRLSAARANAQQQVASLQAQQASIADQIAHANAKTRPALLQQQQQIEGDLELEQATFNALARISQFSSTQASHTGLLGDIDRLENSAPELTAKSPKPAPVPSLQNFSSASDAGLVTQASILFDLLSARRSIDQQIDMVDRLRVQANDLRTPFVTVLRSTLQQGQALTQQSVNAQTTSATNAQNPSSTRKQFDQLTVTFRALADAVLPLSQEVVVLDTQRGTLSSWRIAIDAEYKTLLRSLLIRVGEIAAALLLLGFLSTLWSRATVRYVQDLRRRRQLLVVRRVVVGFIGAFIMLFGFVTQFSSLATFAGFISAGIAVGLQTILLSVAAYFFIIGRYGVRVGDRITVAGVTGTVIEVGLARFYMMELVGSGTELHSTGRVAVFANSVLFQTGTPIYKQLPGTEYAWHEIVAKLTPTADTDAVTKALVGIVDSVYQGYRQEIESQQHQMESWMGTALDTPRIDARLRMTDEGLQIAVLFPVQINEAAKTDEAIASKLFQAMKSDGPLKTGLASTPVITAAIKS